MQVGDVVVVKRSFMGEPALVRAYVYENYAYSGLNGISLITENGVDLGGFNKEEQDEYLEFISNSGLHYSFKSSMKLSQDFKNGYFNSIFGKSEKVNKNNNIQQCTKGHEKSCFYAKSDSCECDCGGVNHGQGKNK